MRKAYKKDRAQGTYCGYPSMKTYGMIIIDNTKDPLFEKELIVGFYVMKRCQQTLDDYIFNLTYM